MRLSLLLFALALSLAVPVGAAEPDLLPLAGGAKASLEAMPTSKLAPLDYPKLAAEDAEADRKGAPGGFRFAQPAKLALDAHGDGRWLKAADGRMVWHWRVRSPDALHLNFGFDKFFLPEGAQLRILAADGSAVLGPYTSAHNGRSRQLWTAPLFANEAILELAAPDALRAGVELQLAQVGIGYRGFGLKSKHCKSGACNTDVACLGANDPWNLPRRAVASYSLGGGRLCTGSLLNNTRGDRRMLFATATHCEITATNAASLVVFWNFESPTCRTPGSTQSGSSAVVGPTNQTQNGATLLAATDSPFGGPGTPDSRSDFTLLELNQPANPAFNLYWAGWDRRANAPFCGPGALCASIHHPDGDEKRITFSETPLVTGDIPPLASGVHWTVQWDSTPPILPNLPAPLPTSLPPSVTEPGSSGSPLYNASQRLVGVLSGGASFCGAPTAQLNDEYGQLARAWDGLGTPTTRVREALDPIAGSAQAIDGIGTCSAPTITVTAPASVAAGANASFAVAATGAGPFTVQFDYDDDGVFDATATDIVGSVSRAATFPKRGGVNVGVRVTDRNNCSAFAQRAVVVQAPDITATAQAPVQICGNGDGDLDPGERWRIPVTLANGGDLATQEGAAIFARLAQRTDVLSDTFGNQGVDTGSGLCPFNYVDLAAEPALPVSNSDDGRVTNTLDLGPNGIPFYGATARQAVMSTNGYLAIGSSDDGGDFQPACGVVAADLGRLNVQHNDFVLNAGGALRRRYFANCPRASDVAAGTGCTVFQWTGVGTFTSASTPPSGSADFQAVVYDNGQIVYQYRTAEPAAGSAAAIGIQNPAGNIALEYACRSAGSAPANRAVCFYPPTAVPGGLQAPARIQLSASRDLGSLAGGASATRDVEFGIDAGAACGAPVGVRYVGTVDRVSSSLRPGLLTERRVGGNDGVCSVQAQCVTDPATLPTPARRDGSFANFSRLGNGMAAFNYINGNNWTFGGGWFTATRDHRPTWYTVQGDFGDRRLNAQAPVQIFRFRQTGTAPFAVAGTVVGSGEITYITPTDLVFTWTLDGVPGGERMVAAYGLTRPPNERTGAWFNPGESGWGVLIEDEFPVAGVQEQLVVNYLFDGEGRPAWTLGGTAGFNGGTATHRAFFVHCPGCPAIIDAPTAAAGTSTTVFSSRTAGTYSTNITLPAPLSGTWVRNNLPLQMLSPPQPAAASEQP
jgi:lysyl endopeptidase